MAHARHDARDGTWGGAPLSHVQPVSHLVHEKVLAFIHDPTTAAFETLASVNPPKPIGLTFIGLASDTGSSARELMLSGTRGDIREKATAAALGMLWLHLGGEEVLAKI